MFQLSETAIPVDKLREELEDPRAGALVTFEGRVRNHNDGRSVTMLEYEAYGPLANKEAEQIISEALDRFSIISARCVHRVGSLQIGEVAVWVGVVSAHRDAAFEACRYIIDEIKTRVPIWKKEHYDDGSSDWVNCASCAHNDASLSHAH